MHLQEEINLENVPVGRGHLLKAILIQQNTAS